MAASRGSVGRSTQVAVAMTIATAATLVIRRGMTVSAGMLRATSRHGVARALEGRRGRRA
jgi:hypothetical protein